MKGQTTAVSAILVTGLTIGAVASVYVWGSPILEKRESQAQVSNIEGNMVGLYDEIVSVKESGEGTITPYELSLSSSGSEIQSVTLDPDNDYINISVSTNGAAPYANRWSFLKGNTLQNITIEPGAETGAYAIKGKDLPGVVMVKSLGSSASLITYRVEFRNMYAETPSGPQLEKIDLVAAGGTEAAGDVTIRIRNRGVERDTGANAVKLPSGREIERQRNVISLDLQ
ncbi:hypothetical protein [Candidatus Nanohalovita haloferacivicina]|uniref:hypothetical protein n=1 Tax=Candidatus Nanohalovita haloferacivicina TaxID=2978046 RepID=UPI00325FA8A7|nr:hypothetical protein HBNXNv_0383 [Candidatus Nanohalobia archaeon BNXNv]